MGGCRKIFRGASFARSLASVRLSTRRFLTELMLLDRVKDLLHAFSVCFLETSTAAIRQGDLEK